MFDAIWDMKIGYVLCGIIWSMACGFAIGNYACSLVHRLPRGRFILDKTPYCGNCGTLLKTADLFPVFSALLLRHKCRYCKQPFPVSHTWTEILVGVLFTLAFFKYAYGEEFILIAFIGVFLITLAAIEANEDMIMSKILIPLAIFGMIYRTLMDGTIFDFVQGGITGLVVSAFIWRKEIQKVGHIYTLPAKAQMMTVGAICVGQKHLVDLVILMLVFSAVYFLWCSLRHKRMPLSVPFGWATILLVMYPQISFLPAMPHPGM